jgi:hypothetical protein
MVLSLKAWKSRSLPGLPRTERFILFTIFSMQTPPRIILRGGFRRFWQTALACCRGGFAYHGCMARLPNSERAIIDIRKIEDYCLDPQHPRGRHKARLFRELLGVTRHDAAWLRDVLLAGAQHAEAGEIAVDVFGRRWRVDVPISRQDRSVVVRTVWIVRTGQDVPRFVTCWVL